MLPKLKTPLFEITIPSTKKNCRFRPFLTKEEKILLMAQAGGSKAEIINSLLQVINNCLVSVDGSKIDVNTLALFDVEYLFLKIRAKSVNNISHLKYLDHEDEKVYEFDVNLDDIEISYDTENNPKIKLDSDIGLILKYPSAKTVELALAEYTSETELTNFLTRECIDKIYDSETVYPRSEITDSELNEFLDNIPIAAARDIDKYFSTLPKLEYTITYTNSKGTDREIKLSSLDDFFTLA